MNIVLLDLKWLISCMFGVHPYRYINIYNIYIYTLSHFLIRIIPSTKRKKGVAVDGRWNCWEPHALNLGKASMAGYLFGTMRLSRNRFLVSHLYRTLGSALPSWILKSWKRIEDHRYTADIGPLWAAAVPQENPHWCGQVLLRRYRISMQKSGSRCVSLRQLSFSLDCEMTLNRKPTFGNLWFFAMSWV